MEVQDRPLAQQYGQQQKPQGRSNSGQQQNTPVLEQFSQLSPSEFGQEIARRWTAAEQIVKQVIQTVEEGSLTPLEGLAIVSCTVGQPFAYAAFHGNTSSPADMAAALATLAR